MQEKWVFGSCKCRCFGEKSIQSCIGHYRSQHFLLRLHTKTNCTSKRSKRKVWKRSSDRPSVVWIMKMKSDCATIACTALTIGRFLEYSNSDKILFVGAYRQTMHAEMEMLQDNGIKICWTKWRIDFRSNASLQTDDNHHNVTFFSHFTRSHNCPSDKCVPLTTQPFSCHVGRQRQLEQRSKTLNANTNVNGPFLRPCLFCWAFFASQSPIQRMSNKSDFWENAPRMDENLWKTSPKNPKTVFGCDSVQL